MNEAGNKDPLWPHFHPLWTDLSRVASDDLLVAGGYGLYLKQRFLLANPALPIAVPTRFVCHAELDIGGFRNHPGAWKQLVCMNAKAC